MKRYIDIVKTLYRLAPEQRFYIIHEFISNLIYNLTKLLPPMATAGIIAVITDDPAHFSRIWLFAGLYLFYYVLQFAALYWNYWAYDKIHHYYYNVIQQRIFNHVVENDSILEEVSHGKITETCSEDVRYLSDTVDATSNILTGAIQLVFIFFIFASYDIFVAIIALAIDIIYITLMSENSKVVARHYEGTRKYQDKLIDALTQILGNLKEVKSLDLMPSLTKKLSATRQNWSNQSHLRLNAMGRRYTTIPILVHLGKIIIYLYLAYLVIDGTIPLDRLVLLVSYFEMVITQSDDILEAMLNLGNYGVRVYRIHNILNYTPSSQIEYGTLDNDYINGLVTFNHVFYSISGQPVLSDISFRALPNEITCIIGRSGAGKTSIIRLLNRQDHVKSGSILIDDESIYNYTKKVYSSNVSGVFEKAFTFRMSIRDNLALIDPNPKHQVAAMKRVGLHQDIEKLPKKYHTILDQSNPVLSEGQLQKLAIARALLTKAEILLFDEVTSNIDPATTTDFATTLTDLKQDHTIIVITHKPEIMKIADQIVVIKDGKVSAKGANADVLKKSKLYQELRNML